MPMIQWFPALLSQNNVERVYYGFSNVNFVNQDESVKSPQEIANCKCGQKYDYSEIFYGQLGHYSCNCGYSRPIPQISAEVDIDVSSSKLTVSQ